MMRRSQPSFPPVVAESVADLKADVAVARRAGKSVGFVPTMGALHAGHVSLIERARSECDIVVTSIFVNPTQFGPQEDFQRYPRPRDTDLKICGDAGSDLVFYPSVEMMYPPGYKTFVDVREISDVLEGAIRPGHFRGVATVVTKLLLIVGADNAYFGQKDFQQQLLIRTLVRDLNISTEIITCPTLRDPDGMAMSSRNAYLTASERQKGLCLSRALQRVAKMVDAGERNLVKLQQALYDEMAAVEGIVIDYAVIADPVTLGDLDSVQPEMVALVAGRVGTTRLIDNRIINCP